MRLGLGLGLALPQSGTRPFKPTSIPNIALWLDAADASTIAQVSGSVNQWNDKSGNGYNAMQPTGAKQMVSGSNTINGLNVLYANAKNMILPAGLYSYFGPSQPWTMFIVKQDLIAQGASQFFYLGSNGLSNINEASGVLSNKRGNSDHGGQLAITQDLLPHIVGGISRANNFLYAIRDGVIGSFYAEPTAGTQTQMYIGSYNSATSAAVVVNYAEILLYAQEFNNGNGGPDFDAVNSYLKTKWGIS
ncbi:hypothetical protein [Rhodopila sp.]|uniref:hypothetical protein n=1 Tax=Rhodopila sp. TaxID=2480087 RepID=UPI003D12AA52